MKYLMTLIKLTAIAGLACAIAGAAQAQEKASTLLAQPVLERGDQSQLITLISDDDHDHKHKEQDAKHEDYELHGGYADKHEDHHAHDKHHKAGDQHGKEDHEEPSKIMLSAAQMKEFAISTRKAEGGLVETHIVRPAEIKFNGDRIVHVIPRVSGTVKSVFASEGQFIKKGSLMAVLDSRELADAKAEYLAATARYGLAKENLVREKRLSRRKFLAKKQYIDTKTTHIEARIALRVATQKLRALGLSSKDIRALPKANDESLSLFSIKAPFSGIITQRHMVIGETRSIDKEALTSQKAAFVIADLGKVWVDISIYPKDFKIVRKNQQVDILLEEDGAIVSGHILFVSPHILEETRTGLARVVLDNAAGRLHPGVYLKARISISSHTVGVRIAKQAVQTSEHGKIVFVRDGNGFVAREIELGKENHKFIEVKSGLKVGEAYVSTGAFTLKAQLGKAAFGDGHNH